MPQLMPLSWDMFWLVFVFVMLVLVWMYMLMDKLEFSVECQGDSFMLKKWLW